MSTRTEIAAVDLQNPNMPGNEVSAFLAPQGNAVGLKGPIIDRVLVRLASMNLWNGIKSWLSRF